MKSEFIWFGYVNQMLYGLDLEREVPDARIDPLATELIEPRFPSRPVATYYRAAVSALESTDWAADGMYGYGDEQAMRVVLTRLISALDARRPWPEPPFYRIDLDEWPRLAKAPKVATAPIPLSELTTTLLRRSFPDRPEKDRKLTVIMIALRTGQELVFRYRDPEVDPEVEVLTFNDPAATISDLKVLTGIEVASMVPPITRS
jgi:hypothetical protein